MAVAHPRYLSFPSAAAVIGRASGRASRWRWSVDCSRGRQRPSSVGQTWCSLTRSRFQAGCWAGSGGRSLVVTLHDNELYELAPRSEAVRRIISADAVRAALRVYVSEALRADRARAWRGRTRSRVIPIGIDTFDDLARRRLLGVHDLLRDPAHPSQEGRSVDTRLCEAGRRACPRRAWSWWAMGPSGGRWRALAHALRLKDKVDVHGAIDRRATMEQIARASVMALPSVMESLGAVYLEAMSLGVPALATRVRGSAPTSSTASTGSSFRLATTSGSMPSCACWRPSRNARDASARQGDAGFWPTGRAGAPTWPLT